MQPLVNLRVGRADQMAMKAIDNQILFLLASGHHRLGETIHFNRAFQQFFSVALMLLGL